jgi:hypothetical protein
VLSTQPGGIVSKISTEIRRGDSNTLPIFEGALNALELLGNYQDLIEAITIRSEPTPSQKIVYRGKVFLWEFRNYLTREAEKIDGSFEVEESALEMTSKKSEFVRDTILVCIAQTLAKDEELLQKRVNKLKGTSVTVRDVIRQNCYQGE